MNFSFLSFKAAEDMGTIMIIAGIAVLVFLLIELGYVGMIQTESKREISSLEQLE